MSLNDGAKEVEKWRKLDILLRGRHRVARVSQHQLSFLFLSASNLIDKKNEEKKMHVKTDNARDRGKPFRR